MKVNLCGFDFNVFGHDWFWPHVDEWEPDTFCVIQKFANPEKVFIDCGAWNGVISLPASKLFKEVVSFEPDPTAYLALTENVLSNKPNSIHTINAALGSIDGTCAMFGDNGDSMSSLVNAEIGKKEILVSQVRLSTFVLKYGFDIGLIKIDIEGGEIIVIPEIMESLKIHKPPLLISFHPFWFPDRGRNCRLLSDLLFPVYCCFNSLTLDPITKEDFIFGLENNSNSYLFLPCE